MIEDELSDFHNLESEAIQELSEFQEYVLTESHSLAEAEQIIENSANPVHLLGINHSSNQKHLESKFPTKVITFSKSYEISEADQAFQQYYQQEYLAKGKKLGEHEKHAEYLVWKKATIVFSIPPDFFTFFSKTKANLWQMVTINEFEYLSKRLAEVDEPPTIIFVADQVLK